MTNYQNFFEALRKKVFFEKEGSQVDLYDLFDLSIESLVKKGENINISHLRPYWRALQILSKKIQINGKPSLVGWGFPSARKKIY